MRKGTCKHFNGIQRGACEAGVNYDTLPRPNVAGIRLPCLLGCGREHCETWEEPSDEDVRTFNAVVKAATERMMNTTPWIIAKKKNFPNGGRGTDECPICGKVIHFVISSYNGHMRAKCETDDCVNFIE